MKNKKPNPSFCRIVFVSFIAALFIVCPTVVAATSSKESAPTERVVEAASDPMR
jgi:hypothetical protein